MPKTTIKEVTKEDLNMFNISGPNNKFIIEKAKEYIKEFWLQADIRILSPEPELDSFEIEKNTYKVTFSYYRENPLYNTMSENFKGLANQFLKPERTGYILNFKQVILNKKGELLKITSQIN